MTRGIELVNGTSSFSQIVTDQSGIYLLGIDTANPTKIYRSTNGGQTFSVLYTLTDVTEISHISADGTLELILITTTLPATNPLSNDGRMFLSTDSGASFQWINQYNAYTNANNDEIKSTIDAPEFNIISVSYFGSVMAASAKIGGTDTLLFSLNFGGTWYGTDITCYSLSCFSLTSGGSYIYCGGIGNISTFYETLGHQLIESTLTGITVAAPTVFTTQDATAKFISIASNGLYVYALTDDTNSTLSNQLYYSSDNGTSFSQDNTLPMNPDGSPMTAYTKIICDQLFATNVIIMNISGDLALIYPRSNPPRASIIIPRSLANLQIIYDITINQNGDIIYIQTSSGIYSSPIQVPLIEFVKSTDLSNVNSIVCSSDGTKLYISDYTSLWYSSNSGNTRSLPIKTIDNGQIRYMVANSDLSYLLLVMESAGQVSLNMIDNTQSLDNQPVKSIITDDMAEDITDSIININSAAISSTANHIYAILQNNVDNTHKLYKSGSKGLGFANQISTEMADSSRVACSSSGQYVFITSVIDTNNAVYVSTNSGQSFVSVTTALDNTSNFTLRGITCSSSGQYVFVLGNGEFKLVCYKSPDYGQTWSIVLDFINNIEVDIRNILTDSTGTHIMIACNSDLYFSDDGGGTWQNNPNTLILAPAVSPFAMTSSGLQQYILYLDGSLYQRKETKLVNSDTVIKYAIQLISSADAFTVLARSATDPQNIYKSVNYGTTFTPLTGITVTDGGVNTMVATSDCSKILYSTAPGSNSQDGKLYLYNGTSSILQVIKDSTGTTISPFINTFVISGDGSYKYMITNALNLYVCATTGGDFIESTQLTGNCLRVTCNSTGQYVFITTMDGKIAISSDYGQSFILKDLPIQIIGKFLACNSNGSIVYFTTEGFSTDDGIYKVTRTGSSWSTPSQIYSITDGTTIFTGIACNSTGEYMVATDDIFFSDDGGATWKMIPNPLPSTVGPVTMNGSGSRIFYTFSGTGMFSRNSSGVAPPCFLEGTKILCLIGDEETYLSVQNLKQGTLVKTLSGFKKVDKIGKSAIQNPAHPGRTMDRLYVCRKENFSELTEDLFITGFHSILVDELTEDQEKRTVEINGRVFEADSKKCLMAAISEKAEPWTQEGVFTIWHFSLEDEDQETKFGVYSNGLLTETCSMDYIPASSLSQKIEAVSPTPKHFFNKSLVCKSPGKFLYT